MVEHRASRRELDVALIILGLSLLLFVCSVHVRHRYAFQVIVDSHRYVAQGSKLGKDVGQSWVCTLGFSSPIWRANSCGR